MIKIPSPPGRAHFLAKTPRELSQVRTWISRSKGWSDIDRETKQEQATQWREARKHLRDGVADDRYAAIVGLEPDYPVARITHELGTLHIERLIVGRCGTTWQRSPASMVARDEFITPSVDELREIERYLAGREPSPVERLYRLRKFTIARGHLEKGLAGTSRAEQLGIKPAGVLVKVSLLDAGTPNEEFAIECLIVGKCGTSVLRHEIETSEHIPTPAQIKARSAAPKKRMLEAAARRDNGFSPSPGRCAESVGPIAGDRFGRTALLGISAVIEYTEASTNG